MLEDYLGGRLVVSRYCGILQGRKFPALFHRQGLSFIQLRDSSYLNNHSTKYAKIDVNRDLAFHICSNIITSKFDLQWVMKQDS